MVCQASFIWRIEICCAIRNRGIAVYMEFRFLTVFPCRETHMFSSISEIYIYIFYIHASK